MLDLQDILSFYLNCSYSHLKSVKLFANMDVKNMFTSDLLLDPGKNKDFKLLSFCGAKDFFFLTLKIFVSSKLSTPHLLLQKTIGTD